MGGCCVEGCKSRSEHGIKVYSIPEHRKETWGNAIKPGWIPSKSSKICEVCQLIFALKLVFLVPKSKLTI